MCRLEHIFWDNASTDRTVAILEEFAIKDQGVKIIVNSRNFGILKSTFNGVLSTNGDAVLLFLPADLQDPTDWGGARFPQRTRLCEPYIVEGEPETLVRVEGFVRG